MRLTSNAQVERNCVEVSLPPRQRPPIPSQAICPVDQVQMADMVKSTFVSSPPTTRNTNKTIIWSLNRLNDPMGFAKEGE